MVKKGYVLIEVMIATTVLILTAIFMGVLQGRIAQWQQQAIDYCTMATTAQTIISELQQGMPISDGMYDTPTMKVTVHPWPHPTLPFTTYTVVITYTTPAGLKELSFSGGCLNA